MRCAIFPPQRTYATPKKDAPNYQIYDVLLTLDELHVAAEGPLGLVALGGLLGGLLLGCFLGRSSHLFSDCYFASENEKLWAVTRERAGSQRVARGAAACTSKMRPPPAGGGSVSYEVLLRGSRLFCMKVSHEHILGS